MLRRMKVRLTGMPFVVYPVKDLARARRFYAGVLGLKRGETWPKVWEEYAVPGGGVLAVSTAMKGCRPGAKGAAVALETDRFDEVVAHLRRRRVKFVFGPTDTGVCDFARFCDPDGNHLILHRKHPRRRRAR
jgi:catechol 2,3-dioxygenase-like lactoylglutathione lyase family enzyme